MASLAYCKRCGDELTLTPRSTNKKFCGHECYEEWWNEERRQDLTNADRAEMLFGPVDFTELEPVQAAWLAAFWDGEGTIGVYRHKAPKKKSGFYYSPSVSVVNTDKRLIDHVESLVGSDNCHISLKKREQYNTNAKDAYMLAINDRAIPTFLHQIFPYLIGKKEQAELSLKFCEIKNSALWRTDNHEIYEHFYWECKALNKRGRN